MDGATVKPNTEITLNCVVNGYPVNDVYFFYIDCKPNGYIVFPDMRLCGPKKDRLKVHTFCLNIA